LFQAWRLWLWLEWGVLWQARLGLGLALAPVVLRAQLCALRRGLRRLALLVALRLVVPVLLLLLLLLLLLAGA
jgi:hypothetical protein